METPGETHEANKKIENLNKALKRWVSSNTFKFKKNDFSSNTSFENIKEEHKKDPTMKVEGTSLKISAALAGKLEGLRLIDSATHYYDELFKHHVIVCEVDEQLLLLDLGRKNPISVAIPINDDAVYEKDPDEDRLIMYLAVMDEYGLHFTISPTSEAGRTQYEFTKVEPEDNALKPVRKKLQAALKLIK